MNPRDVVLAIILLNEKLGRRLSERGVVKIASNVGVDNAKEIVMSLREEGLLDDNMGLTDKGLKEAEEAVRRLEKEVKRGFLGFFKWLNFKAKLAPQWLPGGGGCLQAEISKGE